MDFKNYPTVTIKTSDIAIREDNPQVQTDEEFQNLVESIKRNGFLQEIVVAEGSKFGDKPYEVLSGSHRLRAAIVAGLDELPAKNLGNVDEDERVKLLFHLNVRGKLDKQLLTKIVSNLMNGKMTEAEIQEYLLLPQSELAAIIKAVRKSLPKEMRKSFDMAKVEIKTIDDISRILNRMFNEHGDELDKGYMWFSWGGKDHFYVQMSDGLMKQLKEMEAIVKDSEQDMNELLGKIIEDGWKKYKKTIGKK